jgi:hypothetical protein
MHAHRATTVSVLLAGSFFWTGVIREIGPRRVLIDDIVMVEPGRPPAGG